MHFKIGQIGDCNQVCQLIAMVLRTKSNSPHKTLLTFSSSHSFLYLFLTDDFICTVKEFLDPYWYDELHIST